MNIDDVILIEKIEKLAFMAGAASRGAQVTEPEKKKEALSPELEEAKRRLGFYLNYGCNPSSTGISLWSDVEANGVLWDQLRLIFKSL